MTAQHTHPGTAAAPTLVGLPGAGTGSPDTAELDAAWEYYLEATYDPDDPYRMGAQEDEVFTPALPGAAQAA